MCGLPPYCTARSWSSAWQYISAKRLVSPSIETGSIALSVEIITIAAAPASRAASATFTEPKMLVLTPSLQSRSRIGTCFSAAAWNTMSGLNSRIRSQDARAVADVGDAAFDDRMGIARGERLGDRIERRLRILDHEQARGAEGRDAIADLRADRAATAGDDDALALHQRFQARIVDRRARTQQEILDGDIGQARRVAAFERRQAADHQAEPLRPHQDDFRMRLRLERRRHHHHPPDRLVAALQLGDHGFDIVDPTEHRDVADLLAAIGGRGRQHADRPQPLDGAVLDAAQQRPPRQPRVRSAASAPRLQRGHGGACASSGNSGSRSAARPAKTPEERNRG